DMSRWTRTTPLNGLPRSHHAEEWIYRADTSVPERRFPVTVDVGKPFDVLALKGADLREIRSYAAKLAQPARQLYGPATARRVLTRCPACGVGAIDAIEALRIFEVSYVRCPSCGHGFVREQPDDVALQAVFADSEAYSEAYTHAAAAEQRVAEIAMPKLAW